VFATKFRVRGVIHTFVLRAYARGATQPMTRRGDERQNSSRFREAV
jgi:hypothetical protein